MGTNTASFDELPLDAMGVWLTAGTSKAPACSGDAGAVWLVFASGGLIADEPESAGTFAGVAWLVAATIAGTVAAAAASIAMLRKATR